MKKFRQLSEQYREEGRFKPTKPHNVSNVGAASPRPTSDSANVKLKEQDDTSEKEEMAQTQLHFIKYAAKEILDYIEMGGEIEEWYQNKLSKVQSEVESLHSYIEGEKRRSGMVKEEEQIDEVSSDLLRKAKHKAYALSSKADEEGKTKEADKRFSQGIKFQNREYTVGKKEGEKLSKYMAQKEEVEQIDEKNVPTSPEKWAQAKAQAKAKFDVYPSAYANGWAAKKYKEMGGGWKSVSEANEDLPFEPDPKPKKQSVVPGKHGAGYSTARHLARMAMKKQSEKLKKPVKESLEESRKAEIVKEIMKKKKGQSEDAFQKDPELSSTLTKTQ